MAEATEQAPQGDDPSMEEILQSIRRIIAEDDDQSGDAANGAANSDDDKEDDLSSDILELTEMVEDDGSIESIEAEENAADTPKAAAKPQDVLANIDSALADEEDEEVSEPVPAEKATKEETAPEAKTNPEPAAKKTKEAPKVAEPEMEDTPAIKAEPKASSQKDTPLSDDEDGLTSKATAAATAAAFDKIPKPKKSVKSTSPAPAFRSGESVEGLVQEMLRPMLKEWLDNNLPDLVERVVTEEVRRLSDRRD